MSQPEPLVMRESGKRKVNMRLLKNKIFKKAAPIFLIVVMIATTVTVLMPEKSSAQLPTMDPAEVRAAARG